MASLDEMSCAELVDRVRALKERVEDPGARGELLTLVDELCTRQIELVRAGRMKDEFLGIVSHELRTPLSALLGWCHILPSRTDDAGVLLRGLRSMQRNAETLRRLVDDILDVSRIISGKLSVEMRRTDLEQVVRASLEIARPSAEAKGVRIEASLAPGCLVLGDAQRLQQVVCNVLSNAVKFTPPNGRIDVVLERCGGEVRLTVRDEGRGIATPELPYVFDRFRQVEWSSTRRDSGLGLGLAIARSIVEAHGGRIAAESAGSWRGATFSIDLPLKPITLPPPPPPSSARELLIESLAGRRVLFVDDEPDALELAELALGALGVEVRTASSVDEAMAVLTSFAPDAIVSDVAMPQKDGYDLLRDVRSLPPPLSAIPTIALTAQARADDVRRALGAGFARHVAKPVDAKILAEVLASVVAPAP